MAALSNRSGPEPALKIFPSSGVPSELGRSPLQSERSCCHDAASSRKVGSAPVTHIKVLTVFTSSECSTRRRLGAKLPEIIITSREGQEERQRPDTGNDSWLKGKFTAGEEEEEEAELSSDSSVHSFIRSEERKTSRLRKDKVFLQIQVSPEKLMSSFQHHYMCGEADEEVRRM